MTAPKNLQAFFAQNAPTEETTHFVVSDRFKDENGKPIPFELRFMTEEENAELRKASTTMTKNRTGPKVPEFDNDKYYANMVAASVVFPNLKDAGLQESYKVKGAGALAKKMLLAGEYQNLLLKIQEMNGFDRDINEQAEDVKN